MILLKTLNVIHMRTVLTSTHNLCITNKKNVPLYTPVLLYKSGCEEVYIARTCYPDVLLFSRD